MNINDPSISNAGIGLDWSKILADISSSYVGPTALTAEEESGPISRSDQERVRDILAMMPPSFMPQSLFSIIASDFGKNFNITRVSSDSQALSQSESAAVLAGLNAWAQNVNLAAELAKASAHNKSMNPLQIGLEKYIESATPAGNILPTYLALKNSPLTSASIGTVDPSLAMKAFKLAEQQIITEFLDKWVEREAVRAAESRKDSIRLDQKFHETLFSNYVDEVHKGNADLSQPIISILLISAMGATLGVTSSAQLGVEGMIPSQIISDSIQTVSTSIVPQDLMFEMSLLAQGMARAAQIWSLPVAFAFFKEKAPQPEQINQATTRAYAVTLLKFMQTESFSKFMTSRLETYAAKYNLTPAQIKALESSMKVALLVSTIALMYKVGTGSLTGPELKALLTGDLDPKEEYMSAVLTELGTQLKNIPEPARSKLLEKLCLYYDKNPDTESMMEPSNSFVALWGEDERTLSPDALLQKG